MHEVFSELVSDFEKLQDTITVVLEGGGSRTGLLAIKEGTADIGLSSFPFDLDSILGDGHAAGQRVVAHDAIVVINHQDNPVNQLTNDQISGIYSGLITDWSEIGGEPGEILPVVRDHNSGTQKFFTEHFQISNVASAAVIAHENHEIVDSVVNNKHGIGFIGYAYFTVMVKNVELQSAIGKYDKPIFVAPEPQYLNDGAYPLKRSLRVYFDRQYDSRVMAFLNYLDSKRAHEIIESFGLISTNSNNY